MIFEYSFMFGIVLVVSHLLFFVIMWFTEYILENDSCIKLFSNINRILVVLEISTIITVVLTHINGI